MVNPTYDHNLFEICNFIIIGYVTCILRTYIFHSQNTCTFHKWYHYQIQQIFNYSTTHTLIFNYTCFIIQQQQQILYYSITHASYSTTVNAILFKNNKHFIIQQQQKFALGATKKLNILTLVLSERKILNETKNHNPPPSS